MEDFVSKRINISIKTCVISIHTFQILLIDVGSYNSNNPWNDLQTITVKMAHHFDNYFGFIIFQSRLINWMGEIGIQNFTLERTKSAKPAIIVDGDLVRQIDPTRNNILKVFAGLPSSCNVTLDIDFVPAFQYSWQQIIVGMTFSNWS